MLRRLLALGPSAAALLLGARVRRTAVQVLGLPARGLVRLWCLAGAYLLTAGAPAQADARATSHVRIGLSPSTVFAGGGVKVTLTPPRSRAVAGCRLSAPRGLVAKRVGRRQYVVRVRPSTAPGRYIIQARCGAVRAQRSLRVRAARSPAPSPPPSPPPPSPPSLSPPSSSPSPSRPACAFDGTFPTSIALLGRARFPVTCDSELLARPADRPDAAWRLVSRGGSFIDLALPGPGTWQVRVADARSSQESPSQLVSVEPPACATTRTIPLSSGEVVSECVLVGGQWPEAQRPSEYVLQWLGDRPLSALKASRVAVYFHGDGGCCFDGHGRGVGAFAIRRDMVVVNARAPVSYERSPGAPAWGATFGSSGSAQLGYDIGYDLRQIGGAVGTDRFLYWSDSGGSWFLSSNYIPTGLRHAPGPLALNCGGAAPDTSLAHAVEGAIKRTSPLRFSYGSADFLAEHIRKAMATYGSTGWSVSVDERPNEGHCKPDFGPSNVAWFESVL